MAMESPGFANQASSYSAEVARRAILSPYARTAANSPGILAGGLLSASDMQLTAPASGMSVNVSVGEAIVGGSEGGTQGGYYAHNASQTNLVISTANPSNPRIDTVCVTIADAGYTEPSGASGNAAVLQVVTGTPTSGANLTNLNGKAGLPLSSLLLGYVLVPNGASNIITADVANKATVVGLLAASNYLQLPTSTSRRLGGPFTHTFGVVSAGAVASATVTHNFGSLAPTYFGSHDAPFLTLAFEPVDANNVTVAVGNWDTGSTHSGPNVTFWIIGP